MCNADEPEGFRSGSWVRARKERECYACGEIIRKGDHYHREAGRQDAEFFVYTHCARCWRMLTYLIERNMESVAYDLNCGEEYEYDGNEADPAHALAFMTADESQEWLKKKLRDNEAKRAHGYVVYD